MLKKLYEWLTLADYRAASARATEQIIKRYTRGNVSLQNGWYMDERELNDLSIGVIARCCVSKEDRGLTPSLNAFTCADQSAETIQREWNQAEEDIKLAEQVL